MRYTIARILFNLRFPSGGFSASEFRPHSAGKLVNTHITILPQADILDTRKLAYQTWNKLFRWNQLTRHLLHKEDKIQMVIGFDNPPCQRLKGWIDAIEIRNTDAMNPNQSGGHLYQFGESTRQDIESRHQVSK